jgi:RNA polymerase sigma factor (sigma-70 family)
MATVTSKAVGRVLVHLRESVLRRDCAGLTDAELLDCFIDRRDEAAFEALVRRHGPMVLGVCRRVLRIEAEAEDAFQATFLVLVRKATAIWPRAMVGNWLYGVARKTAMKAKTMNHRRREKERVAGTRPRSEILGPDWQHLLDLLDEELARLPEHYRVPIIACDLEGKSIREAARQLGCPEGTVATRLVRGRAMLARRLGRRQLALSGGLLLSILVQSAASAGVPAPLTVSTIKAASLFAAGNVTAAGAISGKVAALTEGVLKAMLLTKLKVAAFALLALTVGVCVIVAAGLAAQSQDAKSGSKEGSKLGERVKLKALPLDGALEKIVWSKDGKLLATNSYIHEKDGEFYYMTSTVRIWDVQKGEVKTNLGAVPKERVYNFAISPDGSLLAITVQADGKGASSYEVRLVDVEKGTVKHTIPFHGGLAGVAFSADGKRLAFAGSIYSNVLADANSVITLWDIAKGEVVKKIEWPSFVEENGMFIQRAVCSFAFSPNGKLFAAAENGHKMKIWDAETGKLKHDLTNGAFIYCMAFSPDGKTLVAGSLDPDRSVRVWDVAKGQEPMTLEGTKGPITGVAFSPDGKTIAASFAVRDKGANDDTPSRGGEVALWDAASGKLQQTYPHAMPGGVGGIAFAPTDGRVLAIGVPLVKDGKAAGGEVRFWQIEKIPPVDSDSGGEKQKTPDEKKFPKPAEPLPRLNPKGNLAEPLPRLNPKGNPAEPLPRLNPKGNPAEPVPKIPALSGSGDEKQKRPNEEYEALKQEETQAYGKIVVALEAAKAEKEKQEFLEKREQHLMGYADRYLKLAEKHRKHSVS